MFSYLFLYSAFAAVALTYNDNKAKNSLVWLLTGFFLTLFIGLRHDVGGDWYNYFIRFLNTSYKTYEEILSEGEPGYYLLNRLMSDMGWGIYGVNVVCAALFVTGLILLSRRQPNPWLAVSVAMPYLLLVVAMGYTRQGVAIGLVMWGLAALDRGKFVRFIVFVALATIFHKSAIVMIAFGVFSQGKGKIFKIVAIALAGMGIWSAFVGDAADALWINYVDAQMESQGALIRVSLNLVPAILLLLFRKQWKEHFNDYPFWRIIALASIASVGLIGFASTAVDRMALYFIPIQMVVYARLPFLARNMLSPRTTTFLILLLYFFVLMVWLNFAANAHYWVPYHNLILLSF